MCVQLLLTSGGIMTRQEFWQWLDTCPSNWDEDGNRVANPTWDVHTDDYGAIVIRFPIVEEDNE
mgnify:CR=1 FL=1